MHIFYILLIYVAGLSFAFGLIFLFIGLRRDEARKRELAAQSWKYTQHYADAKSAVVEEILARAS